MPTKKATSQSPASEKKSFAKKKSETTEAKATPAEKKPETAETRTTTAEKSRSSRRSKTTEASAGTAADKPKPVRKSKSSAAAADDAKKSAKPAAKGAKKPARTPAAKPAEPVAEKPATTPEKPAEGKAPARKVEPATTTIVVRADVGYGNTLYLRGEGGELSWETGIPMQNVSPDEWSWSTSAEGPVTFKLLINDEAWSAGDNFTVAAGETSVVEPIF